MYVVPSRCTTVACEYEACMLMYLRQSVPSSTVDVADGAFESGAVSEHLRARNR